MMKKDGKGRDVSELSGQQQRIIEILWETGGATVQEVLDKINASREERAGEAKITKEPESSVTRESILARSEDQTGTSESSLTGPSESESASPLAYTTILTFLQKMERSGWVRHEKKAGERAYLYRPVLEKGEAVRNTFMTMVQRFFAGERKILFQHLLDDDKLTSDDLKEIEEMIKKRSSQPEKTEKSEKRP